MEFNIDAAEMERQRYKAIKEKGKYIEVNILIGTEKDNYEGRTGRMPVVTTKMHDCGAEEIACMYLTLKALTNQFEDNYPMECAMGTLLMNTHDIGSIKKEFDENEEED